MIPLLSAVLAATVVVPLPLSLGTYVLIEPYDPKEALLLIIVSALVATAHVLLLGLPAFFALRWRGWLKTRSIAAAGLLTGALPVAVISWPYPLRQPYPYSSSGTWHGRQVDFIADGLPTMFGWFSYLEGVATFGLLGIASALAFWFAILPTCQPFRFPPVIRGDGRILDPQMK